MQINYLKKVVENTAGIEAAKIVDLLYNKKDINEFLIAKKLGLTINQTRNLLYKLSHLGIINSIRKKDKRKGWYIYFWTFDVMRSLEVLEASLSKEIFNFKSELSRKKEQRSYKCNLCGREANEEVALLDNFICPECGEVYQLADNAKAIEIINKNIAKLDKEINLVQAEINKEQEIKKQKLIKFNKRQDKKKKELRMQNRKIKEKLKNKSSPKKNPKKVSKTKKK